MPQALAFLEFLALLVAVANCAGMRGSKDDGSPLFQQARAFDAYVQGILPEENRKELQAACKANPSQNIFCHSVNRSHLLFKRESERKRIARPARERTIKPAHLKYAKKGTLLNGSQHRRTSVDALLKTLHTLPKEQLVLIGEQVLKYPCPNNLASATAATLEDMLPDPSLNALIGKLYTKAGKCTARRSEDREHFYTRGALFFLLDHNAKEAEVWLSQAPTRDAFSGRSLYWLAYVQEKLGQTEKAQASLARLYRDYAFSFHAMVASLRHDHDLAASYFAKELQLVTRSSRNPGVNPLIEQAEVLNKYGFPESAATLAYWGVQSFKKTEPEVKLYLSELGSDFLKVETVPLILLYYRNLIAKKSLELHFPRTHYEAFSRHRSGVDAYLMLALAHKESKFNPRAVSPANATGMLQLNPNTALGLSGGKELDLFDLSTNLSLGSRYFSGLMDRYNGRAFLALAAYNAGEHQADKWKMRYPTEDPVLFIDLLSYRETRNYVGFVLRNYYWYRRLYESDSARSFKNRVGF